MLTGAATSAGAASSSMRQTRCRNRQAPSTPAAVHSTSRSGGLSDSMNQRAVSAPYCSMMRSGSTVLRFDFDILTDGPISTGLPRSPARAHRPVRAALDLVRRQPDPPSRPASRLGIGLVRDHALREQRVERLLGAGRQVSGPAHRPAEEPRIEQVQDRMLDAADILVDVHPVGDRPLPPSGVSARGAVKRAKYQDESTKVSMVSVSRRAGAHRRRGTARSRQPSCRSSGLPGLVEAHILRQPHRQLVARHRHGATGIAVHDRDRASPVTLPADAPVPQPKVDDAAARTPPARPARSRPRRRPRRSSPRPRRSPGHSARARIFGGT